MPLLYLPRNILVCHHAVERGHLDSYHLRARQQFIKHLGAIRDATRCLIEIKKNERQAHAGYARVMLYDQLVLEGVPAQPGWRVDEQSIGPETSGCFCHFYRPYCGLLDLWISRADSRNDHFIRQGFT